MHLIAIILLYAMSLYSGVTAGLGMMSFMGNTTASFLYRVLASYACLIVCAAYGVIASLALRVVGKHRISQWAVARAFQRTMALATGVRFEVIGGKQHLETRPAVFVGNHQTALDVLLLGAIFPQYCSVTAKKSLKRIPVLGWFMSLSGTVFIDRANKSTARKAFEGAAKEIRGEKQSVFIFPEGTRSNAEEAMLLPFKKGAFHLAIQAGAPIVPVVAGCYWGVLGAREYRFRAGTIPVIVLPPIPTANLESSDVDELTRYTRDLMLKAVIKLTESVRGQQAALVNPPIPPWLATPAPVPSAPEKGEVAEKDEDAKSSSGANE